MNKSATVSGAPPSQHRVAHEDLRDLVRDFEAMRELKTIEGADPHLEISALAETITMRFPGEEPALLFDNIKGFPKGYRILSGAANSFRRLAHVYGLPTPEKKIVSLDYVMARNAPFCVAVTAEE